MYLYLCVLPKLYLRWYADPETDVDRQKRNFFVHLTAFHSFSPLNVRETHKVGVAQSRKVITVEIAKDTQKNSENPSNSNPRFVLYADGSGKTFCIRRSLQIYQSNIKAAITKKRTRPRPPHCLTKFPQIPKNV